jgi:hypothetical protein
MVLAAVGASVCDAAPRMKHYSMNYKLILLNISAGFAEKGQPFVIHRTGGRNQR